MLSEACGLTASVLKLCREALAKNVPLIELLAALPQIARHWHRKALEAKLDPSICLGQNGLMVDRVLARMVG